MTVGDNLLELSGAPPGKGALYLYEMSYSQRWSTGILVDIPAWDGKEDPDPVPPEGLGDINGDGSVNVLDVIMPVSYTHLFISVSRRGGSWSSHRRPPRLMQKWF